MPQFAMPSCRICVWESVHQVQMAASQFALPHENAVRHARLRELTRQPPPVWNCHTTSTVHQPWAAEGFHSVIVIHGDQPGHTFQAYVYVISASVYLFTTERPVAGREGAARFPLTVQVARQVMGADAQRLFGNKLDVE